MRLVLDCSVVVGWLMPDEQAEAADRAIREVLQDGADVPPLFPFEVANVLLVSQRRKRIPAAADYLADVSALDLRIDPGSAGALAQSLILADRHGLTVYDAAYLELARRQGLALATLDADLQRAARDADIPLFPG